MLYFTYFIHGNLQYGEFPESRVPEIVEKSYLPTLETFAARPHLRALFEYSGYSLELLEKSWPEAIDLLRELLDRGQIELMGSTLSSPILPLLPLDHARRQVLAFQALRGRLFGNSGKSAGLYVQEFAYDPTLPALMHSLGHTYTILTPELVLAGMRGQLNVALQSLDPRSPATRDLARLALLHPVEARGAGDASVAVIPFHRDLLDMIFDYSAERITFAEVADLLVMLDRAYCQSTPGLLIFGPSDAEFIHFYAYQKRQPIRIEKLAELMERVAELPFIQLGLPGEYLAAYPPAQSVYLPAGTSEPSFDVWTLDPDNQRLNRLCDEAANRLRMAEAFAGRSPAPATNELLERAWRAMLLSENSDGRGWMPCPERRLFCYNQALLAIRLADEILGSI